MMDLFSPLSATAPLNSVVICCKEFVFCPRMRCLRSGNNLTDLLETCAAAATNVGADGRTDGRTDGGRGGVPHVL